MFLFCFVSNTEPATRKIAKAFVTKAGVGDMVQLIECSLNEDEFGFPEPV